MNCVWLWKPFHRHFVHFRRRLDSTASIANVFTTFLLLSFSKILFVSFTLFYTSPVLHNHPTKCFLYYDTTVECHSQQYTIFSAIVSCSLVPRPRPSLAVRKSDFSFARGESLGTRLSFLCVYHLSNNSSHFVSHKTVKVCLMLWISEVACSAHVCGIISGTV